MPSEVSTVGGDQSVEEMRRELAEAREQQGATADILAAISSSPTDPSRVFAQIAASAASLCDAYDAGIIQAAGNHWRIVAHHGPIPITAQGTLTRGLPTGRTVLDRQTLHVADLQSETDEYPEGSEFARRLGYRTILCVPLLCAGEAIGVIFVRRPEVRPFTNRQIELLKTFADQAVIAIENTRLFEAEQTRTSELTERTRDLTEALEYQTATSKVLSVISRSPSQVQPVLDTIAEIAGRLCRAENAAIWRFAGDAFQLAAHTTSSASFAKYLAANPLPTGSASLAGRVVLARRTIHIPDVMVDPVLNTRPQFIRGKTRTALGVPLLRDGVPSGVIVLTRQEVLKFSDKQIELVTTFADQAVIAIENTRLFNETKEALERQTATANILRIISSSPTDVNPVFEAILENACRLCDSQLAAVFQFDGRLLHIVATKNWPAEALARAATNWPMVPDLSTVSGRVVLTKRVVLLEDSLEDPGYDRRDAHAGGWRRLLGAPMLRRNDVIGVIVVTWRDPGPIMPRQVDLLKTFADQAVIAIENTRLFEAEQASKRELQESLEYQTATGEVLGVISRSPTDVQPVFNTIARSAAELCKAQFCHVFRFDGVLIHFVASHGLSPIGAEAMRTKYPMPPGRASAAARTILTATVEEIPDVDADPDFEHGDVARLMNYRSIVAVPMTKEGHPIGAIVLVKSQAGRFPDRQIDLLKTFADQAVIAIENARLFEEVQARNRELRATLEQQTATSEILGVISRSPTDVQPIFDAIAESSVRLCGANVSSVVRLVGDVRHRVAQHGMPPQFAEESSRLFPPSLTRDLIGDVAMLDWKIVHVEDIQNDARYAASQALARIMGYRAALSVPMLRDSGPVGAISVFRQEARRFTEAEIGLLRTFADQAVIAIENSRLFEEVQARNRDLTALGEVGRAVSSTLDLKVVLKTIVDRAVHLTGTDAGSIFYYREETGKFELGETTGLDEQVVARLRKLDISLKESGLAEAIAGRQPLQIPDLTQRPSEPLRDAVLEAGFRASLVVPLLGADRPLGTLILRRRSPGEFSASVVSLMLAFADQSVIALENARLFEEIAQKGRELEIASQHKSQFVANMSHELRTPLAAILGYAELMQEGFYEPLGQKSLDALARIRSNGKHLLGLINTVLDIAKIESGQFTLNMAEYGIESVVETVRSATESLAQNKKLALKTDVAKSLPTGLGDEQRLTQVLLNLVGNAIKFTDTGEVRVTVKAVNGHFNVSVTDTGPGIPEHERARIFEQFHQVDSSLTKAAGGTGLGLAIAKQIVEMHGGRIWVESTVGKGSTFQMEIPTRAEFRKLAL